MSILYHSMLSVVHSFFTSILHFLYLIYWKCSLLVLILRYIGGATCRLSYLGRNFKAKNGLKVVLLWSFSLLEWKLGLCMVRFLNCYNWEVIVDSIKETYSRCLYIASYMRGYKWWFYTGVNVLVFIIWVKADE